jgi:transcriptional regulator with PAS, ATPase and Fis domain
MMFLHELYLILRTPEFILTAILISFAVKIYLLNLLMRRVIRTISINKTWLFLLGTLVGSMFGDFTWILKLTRQMGMYDMPYTLYISFVRISWAFLILQYQSLALFLESLATKNFTFNLRHTVFATVSCFLSCYFLLLTISNAYPISKAEREIAFNHSLFDSQLPLEAFIMRIATIYLLACITLPSLFFTLHAIRKSPIPNILKKQLRIFIIYLIVPYTATETLHALQLNYRAIFRENIYAIIGVSTILLTCALFYCIKRVIGLRFLNFNTHVQSMRHLHFIDDFKEVLEQLSHTTTLNELGQITQHFFKNAFDIPRNRTALYIRNTTHIDQVSSSPEISKLETTVEQFMTTHDAIICDYISHIKVLIHDEIAFSNFYEEDKSRNIVLTFLKSINADIFIPIYEQGKIIAYIVVEEHTREQEFYGNVEHDEMLIFASYLGKSINLLKNRSLDGLFQQEKLLKEELYAKHQEINQFKESMRSFLRNSKQKEIGVIFYKNRRFIYGNKIAKDLIQINLNQQEGHPLTKILRHVAHQVEEYKAPQTTFTHDHGENNLVISAVPNLEHNNVIITVCHPDISDVITKQLDLLKDPTTWDYLLYLETTESGKLINQLIPGSGETLLNFKIGLLQIALTKKAILLDATEDDLLSLVEVLHHINLREQLHVIKLHHPSTNFDLSIKLFGINPMLGVENTTPPLLEKLSNTGTLFIENVHYMNLETQEYLAEFLKTGFYRTFKSDTHTPSNVRIICSTNHNLQALVHEGVFSKALFHELKRTSLCMPSLMMLPEQELYSLADGFTQQALKVHDFKTLFELTSSEKHKLSHQRPLSLYAFKKRVHQMLIDKSKRNHIYEETSFDPAYSISDPMLIQAARLGKHALRDHKIMTMLWNKFKNQNQIAAFLGVNRSSVNRRCKEYNFQ